MSAISFYPHGRLARMIGLREVSDGYRHFGFRWGEVSLRPWIGLWYSVYHDEAHVGIGFGLGVLFVKAPMLIRQRDGTEDWNAQYGFSVCRGSGLRLHWRCRTKRIDWPWSLGWMKTEVLSHGGIPAWKDTKRSQVANASDKDWRARMEEKRAAKAKHSKVFDYRYTRLSGEVQERKATVSVSRMTWGWPRLGLPLRTRTYIDVSFDGEVGEQTGSWKGGTVGCSYDMRPGETPALCLRRMERERAFN